MWEKSEKWKKLYRFLLNAFPTTILKVNLGNMVHNKKILVILQKAYCRAFTPDFNGNKIYTLKNNANGANSAHVQINYWKQRT